MFSYFIYKSFNITPTFKKKPETIHIISNFKKVDYKMAEHLKRKYGIKNVVVMRKDDVGIHYSAYACGDNYKENIERGNNYNSKNPCNKPIKDKNLDDPFDEKKTSHLPDLIIFCGNKLEFQLREYELLYKAEILFSRLNFSEWIFFRGLQHYAECTTRGGR